MTLRAKLFLLVGFAITLAALPIIYFSRSYLMESGIRQERESFANTVTLVEDALSVSYLHLLSSEVESVLDAKDSMKQMSNLFAKAIIHDRSSSYISKLKGWKSVLEGHCSLAAFDEYGIALIDDALIRMVSAEGITDYKGKPVRSMLRPRAEHAFNGVQFAVARIPDDVGSGETSVLLCFRQVMPDLMLVLAMPVKDTAVSRHQLEAQMIQGTLERLESLESRSGAAIAILDGEGRVLAGQSGGPALGTMPEELLAKVRSGQPIEGTIEEENGASLYRLAYFKALDWYIMASIPMSALTEQAQALTRRLIMAAVGLLLLSLVIMLVLTMRLMAPLRLLTEKAGVLAAADLGAGLEKSPLAGVAQDLPLARKDEVGQLALSFANMAEALLDNIRRLVETTAAGQRMQGELNAARDIQIGILPAPAAAPKAEHYCAWAFLLPAKEVGGDLYDFFTAPDGRQVVVIGDVSDKGVPAALFMSMTVTLVRYAIADGLGCAEAMRKVNDLLAENNPSCMFVTLFIGLFDPETGELEYASGAHCPPFVFGGDPTRPVRKLMETSGPLVAAMPNMEYVGRMAKLDLGECCLLYTDGVSEAMNGSLELFGEDRIEALLPGLGNLRPDEIIHKVYEAVEIHRGDSPQSDDITMLCFKRAEA